jgi:hypothetical protein
MTVLGLYAVIVENFYFAYINITIFGLPLLWLLVIQIFRLDNLEIHEDKIIFGFFKRKTIFMKDIVNIELQGNLDINNIHIIINHKQDGKLTQSNLLKMYNVKLIKIYHELLKYLENSKSMI